MTKAPSSFPSCVWMLAGAGSQNTEAENNRKRSLGNQGDPAFTPNSQCGLALLSLYNEDNGTHSKGCKEDCMGRVKWVKVAKQYKLQL